MARKGDFTEILLRKRIISQDQLNEARQVSKDQNTSLPETIIKLGYASGEDVMRAVAQEHGRDYVDLTEVTIPESIIELVPESVARENAILPLAEEEDALKVIVSDPYDIDTVEKLRFILNRRIEIALAPREKILEAINKYYSQIEGESADSVLQEFTDTAIDFTETETTTAAVGAGEVVDENSAPIVRLVQLMITEAVQLRASDIHVEPFEEVVRIRYRIDGMLHKRDSPPRRLLGAIISRIKILAKMDIAERRRPQDGRIKITVGDKELDLRVSIIPTNHGQSVVMRILDKDNIKVGVRQLGLSEENFQQFQPAYPPAQRDHPGHGPDRLRQDDHPLCRPERPQPADRKIITAEDPVEYYLPGINQVEVKHSIGLDFARIIRVDAAAGTQHHPRRRDARRRDGIDGNSGFFDWTLSFQYTTYERCAQCCYTHGRHGCSQLSGRQQRDCGAGPALVRLICSTLQAADSAARERARGCWHPAQAGGQGDVHERQRLRELQQERLPRPAGDFRADARSTPRFAS